ncbi:MAG: Nif3-like dinuclear metal center hexameric protein [Clostridiales bacterium]|nr:Nif3-like dinuclear metal center hexameric protein [Clostridiales bacterium]
MRYPRIESIMNVMEKIAPLELAENWDNVGLIINSRCKIVKRILVTLDVTGAVVNEAIERDIDVIISHHPVIFEPKTNIGQRVEDKNIIIPLIKNGISVYSAHTNLDKAEGGVDDTLANVLGMETVKILDKESGFGRIGRIKSSLNVEEYAQRVAKYLNADDLYILGDREVKVKTVASVAGSGGDFLLHAVNAGADVFITGESKYHESLVALEYNLPIILPGHYETEAIAMEKLIIHLQKHFNALEYNVEVLSSKAQYKIKRTL